MTHAVAVAFTGGRYPHLATCTCGWRSPWGYVAAHAAQIMADDHQKEQQCPTNQRRPIASSG